MSLDRSWKIGVAVALTVVIGLLVWQTKFRGPTAECQPVREMLDYNKAQAVQIESKIDKNSKGIPTIAEETAYRAWADGMAERAQKVTANGVAVHAVQLATLASQFTSALDAYRIAAQGRAPGAPAPTEAYQLSAINAQITDEMKALNDACPTHRKWNDIF
ncbi:hypothetical protein BOO86_16665 [Mycobacterium sp. CBMA 234]|nr:hypothetical protein [Mycolicibacterium sp. CBMA 234]